MVEKWSQFQLLKRVPTTPWSCEKKIVVGLLAVNKSVVKFSCDEQICGLKNTL
jgi:hypothetical protein